MLGQDDLELATLLTREGFELIGSGYLGIEGSPPEYICLFCAYCARLRHGPA